MIAFRAIVWDTWRQSRQQMVFIGMLILMASIVANAIGWSEPMAPRLTLRVLAARPVPQATLTPSTQGARGLIALDLDGEGTTDLALLSAAGLQVWTGTQDGEFSPEPAATLELEGASDLSGLEALDVDGAGGAELVVYGSAGLRVFRFTGKTLEPVGEGCPGPIVDLAPADLDGDGDLDLICAGPAARVWFNAGGGAWTAGPTLGELSLVAAGDLDNDGDPDVIGARGLEILGWLATGQDLAAPTTLATTRSPIWDLAAAKLMGQDQPCLVLASRINRVDIYRRGKTTWISTDPRPCRTPEVNRILVTDYTGDGLDDIGLFSKNLGRSDLWPQVVLRGAADPKFGGPTQLGQEVRGLSAVYRVAGKPEPRIVGLEGFEGIDIPLYGAGNNPIFGPEDESWRHLYAESLLYLKAEGEDGKKMTEREAFALTAIAAGERTALERHAELLAIKTGKVLYTLSLVFFIAACAGYFPGLLGEGGVDLVLARPVSRLQIYLGKFCGGLVLYTLASSAALIVLVLGIGFRFGAYPVTVLAMLPLQVFTAAVMFSILAAIGVFVRSTPLPLLFGLFFYLAIDTGLGLLIQLQTANYFGDGLWGKTIEWMGILLPSFDLLKFAAQAAAFKLNALALKPILTASVWLFTFLGLGYWRFRATDY